MLSKLSKLREINHNLRERNNYLEQKLEENIEYLDNLNNVNKNLDNNLDKTAQTDTII